MYMLVNPKSWEKENGESNHQPVDDVPNYHLTTSNIDQIMNHYVPPSTIQ